MAEVRVSPKLDLTPKYDPSKGVWVLYSYDTGPQAKLVSCSLVEVVKALNSGELIAWWPYGMELRDAISDWENTK